jgi:hypothetical protein
MVRRHRLGERVHQVCLIDAGGKIVGERACAHGGAGFVGMCTWLLVTTRAKPAVISVDIEVSRGPIVETLLERVLWSIEVNPKQLDRRRRLSRILTVGPHMAESGNGTTVCGGRDAGAVTD